MRRILFYCVNTLCFSPGQHVPFSKDDQDGHQLLSLTTFPHAEIEKKITLALVAVADPSCADRGLHHLVFQQRQQATWNNDRPGYTGQS